MNDRFDPADDPPLRDARKPTPGARAEIPFQPRASRTTPEPDPALLQRRAEERRARAEAIREQAAVADPYAAPDPYAQQDRDDPAGAPPEEPPDPLLASLQEEIRRAATETEDQRYERFRLEEKEELLRLGLNVNHRDPPSHPLDDRTRTLPPTNLDPMNILPGYGFLMLPREKWFRSDALEEETDWSAAYLESLLDRLLLWEPRRRGQQYVITVDVSSGVGQDRSVIDVTRVGTLADPDEQVAQFVSSSVDPIELAYYIDPIGRFYCDDDGQEALVAIECNNHGYATQAELLQHCGYTNLFVWRHEDARDPRARFTRAYGWFTTRRTRPVILARYYRAVTSVDPRTGFPDYRINSPHTMAELQDFISEGALWEASAMKGSTDDCIMAGAIAVHVAQTMHFDSREPLAEQRRRISEENARRRALEARHGARLDYQNTDATYAEATGAEDDPYEEQSLWY